jgi:hypothetical protein
MKREEGEDMSRGKVLLRKGDSEEETYPDNCLSKDDFPGKSLFETIFPVDSLFSLASLCKTNHQLLSHLIIPFFSFPSNLPSLLVSLVFSRSR